MKEFVSTYELAYPKIKSELVPTVQTHIDRFSLLHPELSVFVNAPPPASTRGVLFKFGRRVAGSDRFVSLEACKPAPVVPSVRREYHVSDYESFAAAREAGITTVLAMEEPDLQVLSDLAKMIIEDPKVQPMIWIPPRASSQVSKEQDRKTHEIVCVRYKFFPSWEFSWVTE